MLQSWRLPASTWEMNCLWNVSQSSLPWLLYIARTAILLWSMKAIASCSLSVLLAISDGHGLCHHGICPGGALLPRSEAQGDNGPVWIEQMHTCECLIHSKVCNHPCNLYVNQCNVQSILPGCFVMLIGELIRKFAMVGHLSLQIRMLWHRDSFIK